MSYRIEAMGENMVGIISDYETDLLRNPAYVTYQNYVGIHQSLTGSYYEGYDRFSSVIIKNPFGLLIDGWGKYSDNKRGSSYSRYFFHVRTLAGFKINNYSFGLEPGIELYRKKASYYDWKLNDEDRIFRYKLGAVINKKNQYEITVSIVDFMEKYEVEESTYYNQEHRRLIAPRLIGRFSHKIDNTNRIFRLYFDIGHKYTLDELPYESLLPNYTIWTAKFAIGWENLITPKLLVGYAGVCASNIVINKAFSASEIRTNNKIAVPFSVEYKPWNFIFLRTGISLAYVINYNYYNHTTHTQDWYLSGTTELSRSIGLGLKFKRLYVDMVIPINSILYLSEWKTAVHFNF